MAKRKPTLVEPTYGTAGTRCMDQLEALRDAEEHRRNYEELIDLHARGAVLEGARWSQIGDALGLSRLAAWRRFH